MRVTKDSEERKSEIVDAAEKLFQENGIAHTAVSAIVKEVNVAQGLFYYYFKSKDDVIDAISEKYNSEFKQGIEKNINNNDYNEDLNQFLKNATKSFDDMWKKFEYEKKINDMVQISAKSIQEAKEEASKVLKDIFNEGIEEEKVEMKDPQYYANIIVSGISDLVKQGVDDAQKITEVITDILKSNSTDKNDKGE